MVGEGDEADLSMVLDTGERCMKGISRWRPIDRNMEHIHSAMQGLSVFLCYVYVYVSRVFYRFFNRYQVSFIPGYGENH